MEWTSLRTVLGWVLTGGGSGIIASLLWTWGEREFTKIAQLAPRHKRYITMVLSVAFGTGAYFANMAMGYAAYPETTTGQIEGIFASVALSVLASLAVHSRELATA